MYEYVIPLFYECSMRHVPCLTGMDHLTDHNITSKYIQDRLSCYPGCRNPEIEPWTSSVVEWSKDDDTGMDMISLCLVSVIGGIDHVWQGWIDPHTTISPQSVCIIPQTTVSPPTAPQPHSAVTLYIGTKSSRSWSSSVKDDDTYIDMLLHCFMNVL